MSAMSSNWTTPADIRMQLLRLWDSGRLLAAHVSQSVLFPLPLNLRQPASAQLGEQFDEVRRWIRQLDEGSKSHKGYGYTIEWRDINHRQLGRNRMPAGVVVDEEGDALRLIGKMAEKRRFEQLLTLTLQASAPPDIRRLRKVSSPLSGWIA